MLARHRRPLLMETMDATIAYVESIVICNVKNDVSKFTVEVNFWLEYHNNKQIMDFDFSFRQVAESRCMEWTLDESSFGLATQNIKIKVTNTF